MARKTDMINATAHNVANKVCSFSKRRRDWIMGIATAPMHTATAHIRGSNPTKAEKPHSMMKSIKLSGLFLKRLILLHSVLPVDMCRYLTVKLQIMICID